MSPSYPSLEFPPTNKGVSSLGLGGLKTSLYYHETPRIHATLPALNPTTEADQPPFSPHTEHPLRRVKFRRIRSRFLLPMRPPAVTIGIVTAHSRQLDLSIASRKSGTSESSPRFFCHPLTAMHTPSGSSVIENQPFVSFASFVVKEILRALM